MQGNCHIRLGRMLAQEYGIEGAALTAFIYGNIEPDLAIPSHLTRSPQERLEGHSFKAASEKAMRLFYRLQDGCRTAQDYFQLGKLCHYLADSFTWPHNVNYPGNLSAHISYERNMDKAFHGAITPAAIGSPLDSFGEMAVPELYFAAHKRYMEEEPSIVRDLGYIVSVTSAVVAALAETEWTRAPIQVRLGAGLILPECKLAGQTVRQIDSELLPRLI